MPNFTQIIGSLCFRNVLRTMELIPKQSSTLTELIRKGKVAVVGAMYNIATAEVTFFQGTEAWYPGSHQNKIIDFEF